ncbi:hypothetical protein FX985_03261 [Pseudomonas extremaustralis]|uniref:Uncharacterized protein n=1 Tax=Pseudomonas extremaustralis TaxID=359110 RepID=A0A5M9J4B0_9PSED|nr:hypothetical protein [Pseudomonas extremaustralis]KAA8563193.1 hypothetical protein FX985_03261 [Pseudomonas extremaustralis]
MKSYGLIGKSTYMTVSDDYDPDIYGGLTPGWILMNELWPDTRPDRFGDWIAQPTGIWVWVKYPDPPFYVMIHENKLKNYDTMLELPIEALPGNVAGRLAALEAALLPNLDSNEPH